MSASRGATAGLASLLTCLVALSAAAAPGYAAGPAPWPPSRGALLSEVTTGGASASDEFVEIYNAGPVQLDLGGCELVYVSASGSSVTRKVGFGAGAALAPGQHLLVANAAGAYAAAADATFTGGLAGDGGTLVLRRDDGGAIDALSWGTAANGYAEGASAAAPPAGSSLERRPGSPAGSWLDRNSNSADWLTRSNPNPQALAAPPEPAPVVEATADPSALPSSEQTAEPSGQLTPEPSPTDQPSPTIQPSPTVQPSPTDTPPPSAQASPGPSSSPGDAAEPIAQARLRPLGARVHVAGVVSISPGLTGSDLLFAMADASGGIFVRLPSPAAIRVGQYVEAIGTLAAPYGQLEIRDLELLSLAPDGEAPVPIPTRLADIGEGLEGSLLAVEGVVQSIQGDEGRLLLEVGDGQHSLRVLADPRTGLYKADVSRGQLVRVSGVLGQHATATGRLDGYKLWLRSRDDLAVLSIDPGVTAYPDVNPSVAPQPSVSIYTDLATGLAVRGRLVDVTAIVTAPVGIIDWGGPTIVVDDGTAAVAVILPDGAPRPRIGERVRVAGKVGSLHNGRRVMATLVETLPGEVVPAPREVARAVAAQDEWGLVCVVGRITRLVRAGTRWRVDLEVAGQAVAVLGEPASGVTPEGLMPGRLAMVTGIVRRSTSDSDLFYVVPRNPADMRLGPPVASTPQPGAGSAPGGGSPGGSSAGGAGDGAENRLTAVSQLDGMVGLEVLVAGLIVAADGRTALLDDGTGRVRLGGEAAADALGLLEPGDAVEVAGTVARDETGLLVLVDPERILAMPGAGSGGSLDAGEGAPESPGATAWATAGATAGAAGNPAGGLAGPAHPGRGPAPLAVALAALLGALVVLGGAAGLAAIAVPGLRLRLQAGLRRLARSPVRRCPAPRTPRTPRTPCA